MKTALDYLSKVLEAITKKYAYTGNTPISNLLLDCLYLKSFTSIFEKYPVVFDNPEVNNDFFQQMITCFEENFKPKVIRKIF